MRALPILPPDLLVQDARAVDWFGKGASLRLPADEVGSNVAALERGEWRVSGSLIHTRTPLDDGVTALGRGGPQKEFISQVIMPAVLKFGHFAKDEGRDVRIAEGLVAASIEVKDGERALLSLLFFAHLEGNLVRALAFHRPAGSRVDIHESDVPFPAWNDIPDPLMPHVLYELLVKAYQDASRGGET